MNKLRYITKVVICSAMLLLMKNSLAQNNTLVRAQQLYQAKSFDAAKLAIDSTILHTETKGDYVCWSLRAFIYFEIYKRGDRYKLHSALRDTIVSSLKRSNSLKPDGDYQNNNKKLLSNIAINYFNIAKKTLEDSLNYRNSQEAYLLFKQNFKLADDKADFKSKDIEYYNAVGSLFLERAGKSKKNIQAKDTAKMALLKVLEIDPDNASANRNLGIMFCNEATGKIEDLDYGTDISQLDIIQEDAVKLAKQAEQFMLKAYKADEKNQSSLLGLYYIYRILSNQPKMDEFGTKCKNLGIKLDK